MSHASVTDLAGKVCVVTGGASFIGSHLVELLVSHGASVRVIDDLTSGRVEHLANVKDDVEFTKDTVRNTNVANRVFTGADVVFHLAAIHGGRGFIDTYPEKMMENLVLDWSVFSEAQKAGVGRVVHASSACVYPTFLQSSTSDRLLLKEDQAGFRSSEQSFPDGAYGWAKLMGEYQLETMAESSSSMSGRSARIFTAYGSRENESHAIVALWAKAALELDPYPVWGDGTQTRNFTHVSDTVHGLALLALDSRELSFDAFNIGSSIHHTVRDAAELIFDVRGWRPEQFDFQLDKPVGVLSRAADNSKLREVFGWEPLTPLTDGLRELGNWYDQERLPLTDRSALESNLISR